MIAYKVLIVSNGLIALADTDGYDVSKIAKEDINIEINIAGFMIHVGELLIAIPEHIIDFFLESRAITIYPFSVNNYIEEAVLSIELSRESIIEARGVFTFLKKSNSTAQLSVIGPVIS